MNQSFNQAEYHQKILKVILAENGRPIPLGILLNKLKIERHNFYLKDQTIKLINQMIANGELKQLRDSKKIVMGYLNAEPDLSQYYEGTISINSSGMGFITVPPNKKSEYFVHKINLNGALNGDIVQFVALKKEPFKDLKDAKITKIISHQKDFYVCILNKKNDHEYSLIPDDNKMYLPIFLDSIANLVDGQKILVKVYDYQEDKAYATVSRILGHKDDVGIDILSVLYDKNVNPEFPPEALQQANKLKLDIDNYQKSIRKDLRSLPIVTIDPATSKDFDDAIYSEKLPNGDYHLFVCIADVAHYVSLNSPLDEEAVKRGCSIYLVDRVVPMLPHILSNDLCSLNPGVERLTITCEMVIDNVGNFKDIKVYPAIIKSHRRFSYDEVNDFFAKKNNLNDDDLDVKTSLLTSLEIHYILDKYKKQRGYIEFEIPEPIIIVDKTGFPIEIRNRQSGTAQKMIEDFMVAANEAVTIYAEKKK